MLQSSGVRKGHDRSYFQALYDLCQNPRTSADLLTACMAECIFERSVLDSNIFFKRSPLSQHIDTARGVPPPVTNFLPKVSSNKTRASSAASSL